MARTKEQNEKLIRETRNTIVGVALKQFAVKGYAYTSIKDIAEASKMSTGVMYRHFSSKDALFNYIVLKTIEELSFALKEIKTTSKQPYDTLYKMTDNLLLDIYRSEEVSLYFLFMSRLLIEGESNSILETLRRQDLLLFQKTAKLIEHGQLLGEMKQGNSFQFALYYYSSIQGIANMKLFMKEKYIAPSADDILAFLKNNENRNFEESRG